MYFCPVDGKKIVFFRSLGDGIEILCIQTVIIEKVEEEIPKIPVLTFKSFISLYLSRWVKFPPERNG